MWRCPHCGAPQAESARCWVCHRSSTTCSTCRHFQVALSADAGWCALDRKRLPLTGLEQRGCWQERPAVTAPPIADAGVPGDGAERWATQGIDFIPVELVGRATSAVAASTDAAPARADGAEADPGQSGLTRPAKVDGGWTERTSLFGEPEA